MLSATSLDRVLVVAPQPFYEDRGTPIAVRQLVRALSEQGHEIDLLTFPVGRDVPLPGLRIHRVGPELGLRHIPIGLSLRKLLLDVLLVPRMVRLLGTRRYHHVHAVEESVFPALALGRLFGVPVVYDMQSSLPQQLRRYRAFRPGPVQAWLRRCEAWAVRRAAAVVCSAGLRDHVRSIEPGVPVREWTFVGEPHEVDRGDVERAREALALPPRARVVLYAGNFEPYQGLDLLIGAAPAVLERVPGAVFVLVGAPRSRRQPAPAGAEELEARGALRVLPRLPRAKLWPYLALADVLVCPRSSGDNLPLKVFDYMAAGRPIVATDCTCHRRVLDESRALLVAGRAPELAEGLATLLDDRERAARLGAAARDHAARHFHWLQFAAQVSDVYERVGREDRAA